MERRGVSIAIMVLILMGIAVVASIMIWIQMHQQAEIANIKAEYIVVDKSLVILSNTNNSTHTKVYYKITLQNIGNIPLTNLNLTLYENSTITHSNLDNRVVFPGQKISIEGVIPFNNNNLKDEYPFKVEAETPSGSSIGFMDKVKTL